MNPRHETTRDQIERISLFRCDHGTFHLGLGSVTLHLSARELTMIGQAISRWAQKHPEWVMQMVADLDRHDAGEPGAE